MMKFCILLFLGLSIGYSLGIIFQITPPTPSQPNIISAGNLYLMDLRNAENPFDNTTADTIFISEVRGDYAKYYFLRFGERYSTSSTLKFLNSTCKLIEK